MKRIVLYIGFILLVFISCEEIYIADIDNTEDFLVVDARIVSGEPAQIISLRRSLGFYNDDEYPTVSNAEVYLVDEDGGQIGSVNVGNGDYLLATSLELSAKRYQLRIEYNGEIYESEFETAPEPLNVDTIYSEWITKLISEGSVNSDDNLVNIPGLQLYLDADAGGVSHYARYYARKVLEYYYEFDTVIYGEATTSIRFLWKTYYPSDIFNLAGPPEYSSSNDIVKHPLEFFEQPQRKYVDAVNNYVRGWIYILKQYSISESAYSYYKDLNKQIGTEGKIFDPLYVQAEGNIKCISNPVKKVLGNFEISTYQEYRYYVQVNEYREQYKLKKITEFYDIPLKGRTTDVQPEFWE